MLKFLKGLYDSGSTFSLRAVLGDGEVSPTPMGVIEVDEVGIVVETDGVITACPWPTCPEFVVEIVDDKRIISQRRRSSTWPCSR